MLDLKFFAIVSVFNVSLILCNKQPEEVVYTEEKAIKEYGKTEFNFFKNPFTLYWRFGLEPTCTFFHRTIRTICTRIYHKLKKEGSLKIIPLIEGNNNFSFGCYPFKIMNVKKKEDGSYRIQRTNRCPYALESGENLFISHCYTISNSYFIYAAKHISKKVHMKVDKSRTEDAKLVALVTAGKKFAWVWTDPTKA